MKIYFGKISTEMQNIAQIRMQKISLKAILFIDKVKQSLWPLSDIDTSSFASKNMWLNIIH